MIMSFISDNVVGMRSSLRNPFKLLISPEPWLAFIFMLLSFVLGLFWFTVLVTLLPVGVSLSVTLVGLPLLVGTLYLWVYGAKLERARVHALLGVQIPDPYQPLPEENWWEGLKTRIGDPHVWLDLFYLFLLFPVGLFEFFIATAAVSIPVTLVTKPAYYWIGDLGQEIGLFNVDTLAGAIVVALFGVPLLLAMPYVLVGVGWGHAWLARILLGTDRESELTARVDQLTVSRSRALDSAIGDLRRIERDLHDGAQQRLVKLSMDLGMAKEMMVTDPAAAQALVNEAHEEAKRAMSEIRNLARGIHPAVLTDRGLDAAVSALASQAPVPVIVDVELEDRLPITVELTAYFIISEALTNITRHSGATEASVNIHRSGNHLLIDIVDNGAGGADRKRGTGIAGMADRAAALDGTLTIDSPIGGPTHIQVELPCGS